MVHPIPSCGFSRTYVIAGETGLAVVDPGSIGGAEDVKKFIASALGRDVKEVRTVLATHFHIDHIGGVGHLLSFAAEDAKVFFHRVVKDYLDGTRKISSMKNWHLGMRPTAWKSAGYLRKLSHLHFESLAGIPIPGLNSLTSLPYGRDRIAFLDGGGIRKYKLGFEGWDVVETPGHTGDSVCFYHEHTHELICGDLIVNMEKDGGGKLNRFYSSKDEAEDSFRFLSGTVEAKTLYPGHGEPVSSEGNVLLGVETF